MTKSTRILFVCTGNICRSPTAEGVARQRIREAGLDGWVDVDSAGTHGYHVGEAPDPRTQRVAQAAGYDLSGLRARRLDDVDFERFDLLLAMDEGHMAIMRRRCPSGLEHKLRMFTHHVQARYGTEVPDPYYGGESGFEVVLRCCEEGVDAWLDAVTADNTRA